jgi:RNA polymerase sigma-70 factor (ECF subfamily)
MKMQDTELVIQALQGDKEAFGKLVDRYQGAVYGLCFHLVGNFADAQDLAQEAFVRAYLDLHQLREPSKFASWLYRVTMNVCKMWLRKRKTDIASLDTMTPTEFISEAPSPQEIAEKKELQLAVRQAINSLEVYGRFVLIDNVPARVNIETGEKYFAPETVERLQQAVWEQCKPVCIIETPVYEYAAFA